MKLFAFLGCFAATAAASPVGQIRGVHGGTTLRPHLPPGHDPADVAHLIPKLTNELHYRGKSSEEHDDSAYGHMVSTFNHPAVILDHSAHVSSVDCSGPGLDICFADGIPFDITSWESSDMSPVIFSSFFPGCGKTDAGIRSYWRAAGVILSQDGNCVHVEASEVDIKDAMSETGVEWGSVTMDATNNRRAAPDDPKVDISNNQQALEEFFGVEIQDSEQDDEEDTGKTDQDGSHCDRRRSIQKRWSWNPIEALTNVVHKVKDAVESGAKWLASKAENVIDTIVDAGRSIGKAIRDAAGHEWSISGSDEWDWKIGQPDTVKEGVEITNALFDDGEGLVISDTVSCEKCGASGTLTVQGSIAFSFTDGLTKGSVVIGGSIDATLQLAIKIKAQQDIQPLKKELIGLNPTPFEIPGVLSLGPELTLNAELDISFEGDAEFLVGATMTIEPGEASLDLLNQDGNEINGFNARFVPVAKYRGAKISVTGKFGLPVGLEFGVDLFNGMWKKTIGLFDEPSINVGAQVGNSDCSGIEVDIIVENSIYLSAAGFYHYSIRTDEDKIFHQCIKVESRKRSRLISSHPRTMESSSLTVDDDGPDFVGVANAKLSQPPLQARVPSGAVGISPDTGASYRVVKDLEETVIMVSGKEERVYLAPVGQKNADASAPFAYLPDVTENIIISDVYGGFLNYVPSEIEENGVANLRSSPLTRVPLGSRSITLMEVNPDAGNNLVGMYMAADLRDKRVYALAACRVQDKGSRIYLVDHPYDDPIRRLSGNELRDTVVGGDVLECQPVYLTSKAHGLDIG